MIATAPASATQTGSIPTVPLIAKPRSVAPTTISGSRGSGSPSGAGRSRCGRRRSVAKKRPKATHSTPITASVGSSISAAKCTNESPLAWNASRLVRLETGSSSDAELARCAHA